MIVAGTSLNINYSIPVDKFLAWLYTKDRIKIINRTCVINLEGS